MLPTHAKRLAMARGEHVLSNEELLEREIAEARRKEDGWQDPAMNTINPLASTANLETTQEAQEQAKPKMSARPSIKKLFSRNSMQSAKRHSGISTPRNEQSLEFEAGPDYSVHKAGKEPELVRQGPMERSSSYVRRLQGQQQQQGQQMQEVMPQQPQMSRQGSAFTGRSERIRSQELEEWPLPSPGRSSQVRFGQGQGQGQQSGQESPMQQQGTVPTGNGNGTGVGDAGATRGVGLGQDMSVQEKPRVTRVLDVPSAGGGGKEGAAKEKKKEGGCGGCCVVM